MVNIKQIIDGCRKNDQRAQRALYEKYSPVLRGICYRYSNSKTEAEDILHDVFIKIFLKIDQFKGKGSFEGWMKRIAVNQSLSEYKEKTKHGYTVDIDDKKISNEINNPFATSESTDDAKSVISQKAFTHEELLDVVNSLPEGYRLVFNLYAIDNYKHKEIADMLGFTVNTSKSKLLRARKMIQERLLKKAHEEKEKKKEKYALFIPVTFMSDDLDYIDDIYKNAFEGFSPAGDIDAGNSFEKLTEKIQGQKGLKTHFRGTGLSKYGLKLLTAIAIPSVVIISAVLYFSINTEKPVEEDNFKDEFCVPKIERHSDESKTENSNFRFQKTRNDAIIEENIESTNDETKKGGSHKLQETEQSTAKKTVKKPVVIRKKVIIRDTIHKDTVIKVNLNK